MISLGSIGYGETVNSVDAVAEVLATARTSQETIRQPRRILACWTEPDHPKHTHGYQRLAQWLKADLDRLDDVSVTTVNGFPEDALWKDADLVVFFLTLKSISKQQQALIDEHLKKGRSIMVLHQGLVQRTTYDEWADRIGYSFSWAPKKARSKWGTFNNPITLKTDHAILKGFPSSVTFKDELYWNLRKGTRGNISVLGTCKAPSNKEKSTQEWPAIWTVEHDAAAGTESGRVFCIVVGHFDYMQEDPVYRAMIYRGVAWCLREPFAPFAQFVVPKN
jgi:type 1 glutamine amidotransferase